MTEFSDFRLGDNPVDESTVMVARLMAGNRTMLAVRAKLYGRLVVALVGYAMARAGYWLTEKGTKMVKWARHVPIPEEYR